MKLRPPIAAVLATVASAIVGCQFGSGSADGGGAGSSETGSGVGSTSSTANTTPSMPTADSTGEGMSAGEGTTAVTAEGPGDETTSADGSSGSSSSDSDTDTDTDTDTETGGTGDPVEFGPFDSPELVSALSDPESNEDDPSFRVDELEVYFNSDRFLNGRILVSRRGAVTDDWDPPTVEETLSDNPTDTTPELSEDGLVIVISSARATAYQDLHISSRADWDSPWSDPVALIDFSSEYQHYGGTLFGDEMYFCQLGGIKGDDSLDLWRVDVVDAVGGMFGAPERVAELNGDGFDCTVALSGDRREIIFERSESGNPGFELMRSERADAGDAWSMPMPITELNGDTDDSDPWLSADGRRLYYASPRDEGTFDIYMAIREPL